MKCQSYTKAPVLIRKFIHLLQFIITFVLAKIEKSGCFEGDGLEGGIWGMEGYGLEDGRGDLGDGGLWPGG